MIDRFVSVTSLSISAILLRLTRPSLTWSLPFFLCYYKNKISFPFFVMSQSFRVRFCLFVAWKVNIVGVFFPIGILVIFLLFMLVFSVLLLVAVISLLTCHLVKHLSKTSWALLEGKDELISNFLLWTPTHRHTSVVRQAKTYNHLICSDTKCRLENILKVIADIDW